jgi:hypothetical protein
LNANAPSLSQKKFQAAGGFGFKNRLTITWKSANKVKATIYLNAWRVVGANSAPSEIDLPISLRDKLGTLFAAGSCSKRDASEADLTMNLNSTLKKDKVALAEAVIIGANRAPSEFEIRMNLTTNWKVLLLKEVDQMKVLCLCTTIWNALHESFLLGTDTLIN